MTDHFLILTPLLLLPVVWLLRFVGCSHFDAAAAPAATVVYRINCGGKIISDTPVSWSQDDAPGTNGTPRANTGAKVVNQKLSAPDNLAGEIYETCRFGDGVKYEIPVTAAGNYTVTLKFAQISDDPNLQGPFRFTIDGGSGQVGEDNFDVVDQAKGARFSFDYTKVVTVTADKKITITFHEAQPLHGNFPFINAIEVLTAA